MATRKGKKVGPSDGAPMAATVACPHCGASYATTADLAAHLKRDHNAG